jgi:hypothetical protein
MFHMKHMTIKIKNLEKWEDLVAKFLMKQSLLIEFVDILGLSSCRIK